MAKGRRHAVIFRDLRGRFLPHSHRYREDEVAMIQAWRSGRYVDLAFKAVKPSTLVDILSRPEFESLKEATTPIKEVTSRSKYAAWDVASKIDKIKGIRRKDLKLTVVVDDGGRTRKVAIYHKIKRNSQSNYRIFQRINEELGFAGLFLYDKVGSKLLSDRKGRRVRLKSIIVEEVL